MKRYILTKYGRIIDSNDWEINKKDNGYFELKRKKQHIDWLPIILLSEKEIIKCSDNVEDLFDEVVIINPKSNTKNPFLLQQPKKPFLLEALEDTYYRQSNNIQIYGAVWTDKGLIYVAKLDEKGEWEVL